MAESARLADLQELLDQCMDKLPPADRELLDLRYRSDLPVKALAAQLGRPLSTTYEALNRIRRNLVECVQRALSRAGEGIAGTVQKAAHCTAARGRRKRPGASSMNAVGDRFAELYELACAQCEGTFSPHQIARLENLVLADADQRRQYVLYMHIHAQIEEAAQEEGAGLRGQGVGPACRAGLFRDQGSGFGVRESDAASCPFPSIHHSGTFHPLAGVLLS